MKKFEEPIVQVIALEVKDVISTSQTPVPECPWDGGEV